MTASAYAWPLATLEPGEAFARLTAHRRGVFWLDSSLARASDGRYSVMGCEPRWVFSARGSEWSIERNGIAIERGTGGPLTKLDELLARHRVNPPASPGLPFWGGAIGWFSYDLGRQFEKVDETAKADLFIPDLRLAWHDAAIVWDHQENQVWLVGAEGERTAEVATSELAGWLSAPPIDLAGEAPEPETVATSDLPRADYEARVEAIRERIARGEVYQVNLVRRFDCFHGEAPAKTYVRLRACNPAPFALYQDAGGWAVLSSSPERFLEVEPSGRIRTCPIKGTRPRGRTDDEDASRRAELSSSEKERAELLMIVDLLRNDLGRVCEFGSIQVSRLHALESFATVHHLVGEVTGQLRPDVGLAELLRATFPGGSITGAPKVSALRVIESLERHRRGLCMGALGYVSAHGRIDLSIAIRTIICGGGRAYFYVGAGIVWDSNPAAEYEETLAKARALFAALGVKEDKA